MIKKLKQYQFIQAISVLTATIVGAGVLALPYTIYYAGYWVGIVYLLVLGVVMMVLNMMLGEVILRTKKNLHIPELVKLYLGKKGYLLALFSFTILIYGGMAAYIRGFGDIMNFVLPSESFNWSIVFFTIGVYFVFKGLKVVSRWDSIFVTGMVLIVLTLWLRSIYTQSIDWNQFQIKPSSSFSDIFKPYGAVLFSYFGVIAIPHIKSILGKNSLSQMKTVIKLGVWIPILLYSIFVSLVIGVSGASVTPVAIISLGENMGQQVLIITSVFAIIAMMSTYITMGLSMVDAYMSFGKINKNIAIILSTLPSMAVLLFDWAKFDTMIQYSGGIGVGILSILIVLTFWKAKVQGEVLPAYSLGHMKWVGVAMILVFCLGIITLFI